MITKSEIRRAAVMALNSGAKPLCPKCGKELVIVRQWIDDEHYELDYKHKTWEPGFSILANDQPKGLTCKECCEPIEEGVTSCSYKEEPENA